jgi:uncharacterized protein (UPF0128 family)
MANQIMVSVSSDQMVKIHSVVDKVEDKFSLSTLSKNLCIDIHPIGFQIVLGFKEGFRVYFYLNNDLRQIYEMYCKQCNQAKYSNRGDMLAILSGNMIMIYDPYTFEKIKEISEHTNVISKPTIWS